MNEKKRHRPTHHHRDPREIFEPLHPEAGFSVDDTPETQTNGSPDQPAADGGDQKNGGGGEQETTEPQSPLWKEKLKLAPLAPGCYLMKSKRGKIIYIGKAKNLRSRIRQYFQPNTSDTRGFVRQLDVLLGDIEFIITSSEKEALILENNLIKKHKPRFNVFIKDDKTFFSLKLDLNQTFPHLEVVRRRYKDRAKEKNLDRVWHFGPYPSAKAARQTLRLINRYFQLCECKPRERDNRSRACLRFQMHRCMGACVGEVTPEVYRTELERVKLFLEGRSDLLLPQLEQHMKEVAANLEFERAAHIRDQIEAVKQTLERQQVEVAKNVDWDAVGLHREGELSTACVVSVRAGAMTGAKPFELTGRGVSDEDILSDFLMRYYDGRPLPQEVLLPFELEDQAAMEELFQEWGQRAVKVLKPQRGRKAHLVKLAVQNAQNAQLASQKRKTDRAAALEFLKRKLHLLKTPHRMECFDISHFQGALTVASMVCFIDGEPAKAEYRKYKIRSVKGPDDFGAMYEVLSRRFKRGVIEGGLPDLVVIDGGKGQLSQALAVLEELGVRGVEAVALAKSRVQSKDDGDATPKFAQEEVERSYERVFLPKTKNPMALKPGTAEAHLMARLRDESHRFAITFYRSLQRKKNLVSYLDEIPGVGTKRRKVLLKHFGSLKRVREASLADLKGAPGIPEPLAETIHAFLRDDEN